MKVMTLKNIFILSRTQVILRGIMDAPANTLTYFIAGYVVIFGSILAYLVSLYLRNKNLAQDEEMLKELEKKQR
jgi:hypothetical protein